MFSGNSLSAKKLYLLYDRDNGHYTVITNFKGAMAKKYISNACDTLSSKTHKCRKVSSLCTATPPCSKDESKYCATCNRWFLSEKCFQDDLILNVKGKLVCQWRQVCRNCSYLITFDSKHECFKKYCTYSNKKQLSGHLRNVAPLKPSNLLNKYLYVFFDTECTQNLESVIGIFSMYRTTYVLSRCVLNVKLWMMIMSTVNSVERVSTLSGKTPRQIYRLSYTV
jgi:virulence-associated protein VapD